ncbi:MAG: methyltransferase domain-containing protein [Blastocatellia bacterium]
MKHQTKIGTTNFGAAAADYAKFRAGFPDSFFDRLAAFGIGASGETVVDLGTGTGTLARKFAQRGCKVIGIDPDERLLNQARQLDAAAAVSIDYKIGYAEAIPLADDLADIVSAGQCWHWFDGPRAAWEIARVTRPHGRVVVAYFSWLPWPGNVVEATEHLIMKHNPNWHFGGGNGFDLQSLPHLYAAGFSGFETFSYDMDVAYSTEAWRGRIRASAGVGASLAPVEVEAFDAELARLLMREFPGDVLQVPHRVFAIIGIHTAAG